MKRLIDFFTSNWGLKILALILALVVFYSMKETNAYDNGRPTFNLRGSEDGGK